jgi:hypothetical protein
MIPIDVVNSEVLVHALIGEGYRLRIAPEGCKIVDGLACAPGFPRGEAIVDCDTARHAQAKLFRMPAENENGRSGWKEFAPHDNSGARYYCAIV